MLALWWDSDPAFYLTIQAILQLLQESRSQFSTVKTTACVSYLLEDVDTFTINGTILAPYSVRSHHPYVNFSIKTQQHDEYEVLCVADLRICARTDMDGPIFYPNCFCEILDRNHITLNFTLAVNVTHSEGSIKVVWRETQLFEVPQVYRLGSSDGGIIQGISFQQESADKCSFYFVDDVMVKYCCNEDMPEPCVSTILYQGDQVTQNASCATLELSEHLTEGSVFTFSQHTCGLLDFNATCVATLNTRRHFNKEIEKHLPLLIGVSFLLAFLLLMIPVFFLVVGKRAPGTPLNIQPGTSVELTSIRSFPLRKSRSNASSRMSNISAGKLSAGRSVLYDYDIHPYRMSV